MKIKLDKTGECCDCGAFDQWIEDGDIEVEVPDAIVSEWRACWDRIEEIEKYFDERVQPQIDEVEKSRRAQWRRDHPEEASRNDVFARMLIENAERQAKWMERWVTGAHNAKILFQDDLTKKPGDKVKF